MNKNDEAIATVKKFVQRIVNEHSTVDSRRYWDMMDCRKFLENDNLKTSFSEQQCRLLFESLLAAGCFTTRGGENRPLRNIVEYCQFITSTILSASGSAKVVRGGDIRALFISYRLSNMLFGNADGRQWIEQVEKHYHQKVVQKSFELVMHEMQNNTIDNYRGIAMNSLGGDASKSAIIITAFDVVIDMLFAHVQKDDLPLLSSEKNAGKFDSTKKVNLLLLARCTGYDDYRTCSRLIASGKVNPSLLEFMERRSLETGFFRTRRFSDVVECLADDMEFSDEEYNKVFSLLRDSAGKEGAEGTIVLDNSSFAVTLAALVITKDFHGAAILTRFMKQCMEARNRKMKNIHRIMRFRGGDFSPRVLREAVELPPEFFGSELSRMLSPRNTNIIPSDGKR